jgi:rhamnosyltransferase
MADVSILIRTRNEARWLPITVRAINAQTVQPREIVIVDSGSTDGTLETVKGLAGIRVCTMTPESFTFGRALNRGFQEAVGEYVACLSAHAVPADDAWLASLLHLIQHPRTAGVYGRQLPQPDASAPIKRDLLTYYGVTERIQSNVADHFFSNANALIRRDVWQLIPFDEGLTGCEDQIWARNVIAAGYRVAYEPRAAVYHSHNETLAGVYRRAYREALAWWQLDPSRRCGVLDFCREWRQSTAADVAYILRSRAGMRWLFFSAGYRLAQTLGRNRAFRNSGRCATRSPRVGGADGDEETRRDG